MPSELQRQRSYWNDQARLDPDAAVIDPNDQRGFKNLYLAGIRDQALATSLSVVAPGEYVLDFGCGSGSSTKGLLAAGHPTLGIDIAQDLLRHARRRCKGQQAAFVAYDGETLPLLPACVSATAIYVVLSYVVDDDAATKLLGEIRTVMQPGARIAMIEQARRRRRVVESGFKVQRRENEWRELMAAAGFSRIRSRILRHGRFPTTPLIGLGLIPSVLWSAVAALEGRLAALTGVLPWDYAEILLEAEA